MLKGHGDDLYAYGGRIKHNFSSNVYGHFDHSGLKKHLAQRLDYIDKYPEPDASQLEEAIAQWLCIPTESLMVTAGATDAIYTIANHRHGGKSVIVGPTFSEYEDACIANGHQVDYISIFAPIVGNAPDYLWICNPNNPDGRFRSTDEIIEVRAKMPDTTVILDQAYADYTDSPMFAPAESLRIPNLICLHSMTKSFGVPGLRVGYITGPEAIISQLKKLRKPWSISQQAIDAGIYLIKHKTEYTIPSRLLISENNRIASALEELGIEQVGRSQTNFSLYRLPKGSATELKEYLAENHSILIRDASNFHELDERYFRVAAQLPEENDLLINAIRKWIESLP